ncbi:MAG: hypothetical protein ABMB14_19805, partial [Myxococcota bacterium]
LGEAAGEVVAALLARAPALTVLGTSRTPLRVAGERLVTVAPLALADAIALFADRAIRPPADADAAVVASLVGELDGLPLAIELAAARTAALSPTELRDRARESLRLLVSRDPRRPERHRSLRASLDTSFELLSPAAREVLPRLAVLEGSFRLAAAEAVAWLGDGDPDPLDVLEELVDWSLLRTGADHRWSLPVPVRQYAAERLTPTERTAAEQRHGRFFAEPAGDLFGPDEVEVLARLAEDLPNRIVAIERAIGRGDGAVSVGALRGAFPLWLRVGPVGPGIALAERIAALDLSPVERGAVERQWALLLVTGGEFTAALAHLERARPLDDHPDSRYQLALAAFTIASNLGRSAQSVEAAREALRWAPADDPTRRCRASIWLARAATEADDWETASTALLEAERLAADHAGPTLRREIAERRDVLAMLRGRSKPPSPATPPGDPAALSHRAMLARLAGRPELAVELGLAAVAGYERVGNRLHRAQAIKEVGTARIELGQLDLADAAFLEALGEAEALGVEVTCAHALHCRSLVALERGDLPRSEALIRDALARAPGPEPVAMFRASLGWILWRAQRADESAAELDAAAAVPRLRSYVLLLLGDVRAEQGRLDEARALLEEARADSGPIQVLLDQASTSLAGVLARLGDLDAAAALLADVASRPSLAPTRRAALGLATAELALARGALDDARRALADVPPDPRIAGPRWAELAAVVR